MAGLDDRVSIPIDIDSNPAMKALQEMANAIAGIGPKISHGVKEGSTEVLGELAKIAGAVLTVEKALEMIGEGFKHADFLRDLRASTDALTGSAAKGEQAWDNLEAAAEKTRITGNELVQLYGHALPLAMDRGFSQEGAQKLVAQVAKLAPAIGQSVGQAMDQMDQILAGRVRKTNLLAHVLGLDPDSYSKGLQSLDSVFPKIDELAKKGEAMGQTWQSTGAKIKDALEDAFGEGMNRARDGVTSAQDVMLNTFKDPAMLESIRDIGKTIAELAPAVSVTVRGISDTFRGFIDGLKQMSGHGGDSSVRGGNVGGGFWATVWDNVIGSDQTAEAIHAKFEQRGVELERLMRDYQARARLAAAAGISGTLPGFEAFASDAYQNRPPAPFDSTLAGSGEKTKRNPQLDAAKSLQEKIAKTVEELTKSLSGIDLGAQLGKSLTLDPHSPAFEAMDKIAKQFISTGQLADAFGVHTSAAFRGAVGQAQAFEDAEEKLQRTMKDLAEEAKKVRDLAGPSQDVQTEDLVNQADRIAKAFDLAMKGIDPSNLEAARAVMDRFAPEIDKVRDSAEKLPGSFAQISPAFLALAATVDATDFDRRLKRKLDDMAAAEKAFILEQTDLAASIEAINQKFGGVTIGGAFVGRGVLENEKAIIEEYEKAIRLHQPLSADMKKALDQLTAKRNFFSDDIRRAAETFSAGIENSFVDLATTGGKNFGEIMSKTFMATVADGAKGLSTTLSDALFGLKKDPNTGQYVLPGGGQTADRNVALGAAFKDNPVGGTAALALQGGAGAYNTRGQSDIEAGIGAAAAGYSAAIALASTGYGIIAGIIVAAATYAGHLLQPSPSESYKYGTFSTDQYGRAMGTGNENVDKNQMTEWLSVFQSQVDTFYNGYMKILLKFPHDLLPEISKVFAPVVGQFEQGADLGLEKSQRFTEELDRYFKEGLPHQIADRFSTYTRDAFVKLGFSSERFSEIWQRLSNLDPKEAMAALSELADVAIGFDKYMRLFKTQVFGGWSSESANPETAPGGRVKPWTTGLFDTIVSDMNRTFGQQLEVDDQNIIDMGDSLKELTGQAQIDAARDLSKAMEDRYNKEVAFLQTVARQIDVIKNSFEQQMQGYTLAGMKTKEGTPDYEAQAKYLKDQTDKLYAQLGTASSPEEVTRIYNQIAGNIDKIYQLGSNLGPEAEAAYRKWAQENLQKVEDAAIARQNELAQQVQDANQRFVDAIQGFIDAFETAAEDVTTTITTGPGDHGGGPGDPDDPRWLRLFSTVSTSVETSSGAQVAVLQDIKSILAEGRNIRIVIDNGDGTETTVPTSTTARSGFGARVASRR